MPLKTTEDFLYGAFMAGAHLYVGSAVARRFRKKKKEQLYGAIAGASPDFDVLLFGWEGHRGFMHSIPGAPFIASLFTMPDLYRAVKEGDSSWKNNLVFYTSAVLSHLYLDFFSGSIQAVPGVDIGAPIIPSTDPLPGAINHWLAAMPFVAYEAYDWVKDKISRKKKARKDMIEEQASNLESLVE